MAGDAVSPVGRTRTFPAPDAPAARLRVAYASCQRWEHGYFSAWRHMRDDQPDVVLFLGDYIYEYPGAPNAVRLPTGGWVLTLDDYRARYALHRSEPELQAMHAACPWLVTWDDHEVQNDYAGLTPGNSGPPVADFAARRAAAYQAFYEHMPLRASVLTQALAGLASGAEMRIYGQVPFGRLATLYLLDDRQYRDPRSATGMAASAPALGNPERCVAWTDPRRTLLGAVQEQWLDRAFELAAGGVTWNVVGQQTLFGPRDFRPGPGVTLWNDGWDGYEAARSRLTDSLQRHHLANPVLLGGDVHENWPLLRGFDGPLAFAVFLLACAGLLTMYSSGFDHGTRFMDHGRNMLIAGFHHVRGGAGAAAAPDGVCRAAVCAGVALLVAVALFGITKKGATRWLNVGMTVIQPSEILKIAMPLMLAWWFQKREGQLRPLDFPWRAAAGRAVGLIMKQPDLGTSLLVLAAGLSVIFFAGLSWKLIVPPVLLALWALGCWCFLSPNCAPTACAGRAA
jgi:hypothetical protein